MYRLSGVFNSASLPAYLKKSSPSRQGYLFIFLIELLLSLWFVVLQRSVPSWIEYSENIITTISITTTTTATGAAISVGASVGEYLKYKYFQYVFQILYMYFVFVFQIHCWSSILLKYFLKTSILFEEVFQIHLSSTCIWKIVIRNKYFSKMQ